MYSLDSQCKTVGKQAFPNLPFLEAALLCVQHDVFPDSQLLVLTHFIHFLPPSQTVPWLVVFRYRLSLCGQQTHRDASSIFWTLRRDALGVLFEPILDPADSDLIHLSRDILS